MVKILITDATLLTLSLTQDPVIPEGYIYLKDGRVMAVGKGKPPEELRYPELLLSGRGRVVMPGLSSAFTSVTLHPLRFMVSDVDWESVKDFLSLLGRRDVYYLAGMSFMEMMSRGITSALVTDIFLDDIARAAREAGFYVTLAPPFNCGLDDFGPANELKLLMNRWHGKVEEVRAAVLSCREPSPEAVEAARKYGLRLYVLAPERPVSVEGVETVSINPSTGSGTGVVRYGSSLASWMPEEGLGIGVRPSYSMLDVVREASLRSGKHPLDALYAAAQLNTRLIGLRNAGSLDVGTMASLVMFNTAEPPSWPAPKDLNSLVKAVVMGELSVETVVAGDSVLVDSGETLTLGSDLVRRAREKIEPVLREYLESK